MFDESVTTGLSTHRETYELGLSVRRRVLGPEHVDRSMQAATSLTMPIQELVTEYCWGEIWGRADLDLRSRSLVNLGILTALNRPHELSLHVKGAVRNGVSIKEIQEALLQCAVYVGVPAALDAFRVAESALGEMISNEELSIDRLDSELK